MPVFKIQLALSVEVDDKGEAAELGTSMLEHLFQTFNDNETLLPPTAVHVINPERNKENG